MTLYQNDCQTIQDDLTDVTTTNTLGPNQFTAVSPGAGGTIKVRDELSPFGVQAIEFVPATGVTCYVEWSGMTGGNNQFVTRLLHRSTTTLPSNFQPFINIRNAGGSIAAISYASDNKVQVTAVVAGTSSFSSGAFSAATWYDISLRFEDPTITTGACDVVFRDLAGTTISSLGAVHGTAIGAGTANFGTGIPNAVRYGKTSATGAMAATRMKFVQAATGQVTALGAYGPNNLALASILDSTNWTALNGSTIQANLADTDPTTGATSAAAPSGQLLKTQLPSLAVPTKDFVVACEGYRADGATSGSILGYLYEGATLRATSNTVAAAASNGDVILKFEYADLSAITSGGWATGLELWISATAS